MPEEPQQPDALLRRLDPAVLRVSKWNGSTDPTKINSVRRAIEDILVETGKRRGDRENRRIAWRLAWNVMDGLVETFRVEIQKEGVVRELGELANCIHDGKAYYWLPISANPQVAKEIRALKHLAATGVSGFIRSVLKTSELNHEDGYVAAIRAGLPNGLRPSELTEAVKTTAVSCADLAREANVRMAKFAATLVDLQATKTERELLTRHYGPVSHLANMDPVEEAHKRLDVLHSMGRSDEIRRQVGSVLAGMNFFPAAGTLKKHPEMERALAGTPVEEIAEAIVNAHVQGVTPAFLTEFSNAETLRTRMTEAPGPTLQKLCEVLGVSVVNRMPLLLGRVLGITGEKASELLGVGETKRSDARMFEANRAGHAQRVAEARLLSVEQVAEAAGVPLATVASWVLAGKMRTASTKEARTFLKKNGKPKPADTNSRKLFEMQEVAADLEALRFNRVPGRKPNKNARDMNIPAFLERATAMAREGERLAALNTPPSPAEEAAIQRALPLGWRYVSARGGTTSLLMRWNPGPHIPAVTLMFPVVTAELERNDAQAAEVVRGVTERLHAMEARVAHFLDEEMTDIDGEDLSASARGRLRQGLVEGKRAFTEDGTQNFEAFLCEVREGALGEFRQRRARAETLSATGFDDYPNLFPLARSMSRELVFYVGPTNSGKTHAAMEELAAAHSGCYLAPLRLLALEGAEALRERGTTTSMVTGEEEDIAEGARHVAGTIETVDLSREVEVAVIDEIQMLRDDSRGWAWSQALFGVPARRVVMTGSAEALAAVRAAAAMTGETLTVRKFQRMSPLKAQYNPVEIRQAEPGDAFVAFSRADVLDIRSALMTAGHKVAVIYGALGPEVRRAEARRFRSGEAKVLVATDAIGMGLNLPVRRIVLTSMTKWDGKQRRPLTASEIRQLGGRAGRYGGKHTLGGFVAVSEGNASHAMIEAIEADPADEPHQGFSVLPSRSAVRVIGKLLETQDLSAVLEHFHSVVNAMPPGLDGSRFQVPDLTAVLMVTEAAVEAKLSLEEQFSYVGVPVSLRLGVPTSLRRWMEAHASGTPVRFMPGRQNDGYAQAALDKVEDAATMTSAYLWLSMRLPEIYVDGALAALERTRLTGVIERALAGRGKFTRRFHKKLGRPTLPTSTHASTTKHATVSGTLPHSP